MDNIIMIETIDIMMLKGANFSGIM